MKKGNDKDGEYKDGEYEVGYGKPPKHTRFSKGSSGNPRGRPRGAKNWATLVRGAVFAQVEVRENGRPIRRISKLEAAVTQLVNKAASGNLRALAFLRNDPALDKALQPKVSVRGRVAALEEAKLWIRGSLY